MSCLGVHFALSDGDVAALLAASSDEKRLNLVKEIEDRYFQEPATHLAQSDKSWDAMHRTCSDGLLTYDGGVYPLNHVVLGGRILYGQDDYIMSLKLPHQVKDVAAAVTPISEDQFRQRYFAINAKDYDAELGEQDFEYTWQWFQDVRALFQRAAAENLHVLFTADQ
jgi:Domain of unknown function (DUF1877)